MTTGAAWVVAAALWVGALTPGPWWLAPAGLVLLGAGAVTQRKRAARRRRRLLAVAAVAMLATGSGLAGGREAVRDGGLLPALAARGGSAALEATVATEARPVDPAPWEGADAAPGWLLLRVTRLDDRQVRERAFLRLDDIEEAPALGERVRLTASARPLDTDGFGGYLRRMHTAVALDADRVTVVEPAGPLLSSTTQVRARTRRAFARRLGEEDAALLAGLVVGDRRAQASERGEAFAAAGLTHLVVVSGRHVALMLAAVMGVCALLRLGARTRRWTGLAALAWFVVLVRWQPSVLRASAMGGLVLAGGLLGRGRQARHALAVAVTLVLLADPLLAGHVGFGLSVLATGGVLGLAPWIAERLPGPRGIRVLAATTVGAQLGAAPVLLGAFGEVSLMALPANLLAVPAAVAAQMIGMAAAAVAQVSTVVGGMLATGAGPALAVVRWAAETFSTGPALRAEHLLWAPVAVLGLVGVLVRHRAPKLATLTVLLVVLLVVVPAAVFVAPLGPARRAVVSPTLTAFDVGQGDALLVEIPGDPPARLLYDGGPEPDSALAHLTRRGIDRLDAVVSSHPHLDHVAGLPAVLTDLAVGALLVGPPDVGTEERPVDAVSDLFAAARHAGVRVVDAWAGQRFLLGNATVEVLSPPRGGVTSDDPNDASVVLLVHTPAGRILLTGDAEAPAQQRLLGRPERLRAEVLHVPHHGGATNADGFLDTVDPDIAVISVGADNEHGHPHPGVLARLRGIRTRRTDQHGTVTVELPPARAHRPRIRAAPRRATCLGRVPRLTRPPRPSHPRSGGRHGLGR